MRKLKIFLTMLFFSIFIQNTTGFYVYAETPEEPEINSVYGIIMDADTGEVLYSKNGDTMMYPASMTKIMTAVIAIEELPDLQETFLLTEDCFSNFVSIGASMAGFGLYDSPTFEDLLYGLLLPSGAECAEALAIAVSGSSEAFVEKMNQKAAELGMIHTNFDNATGLHEATHYSTCYDMALLVQYARQNETFVKINKADTHTSIPVVSAPQGLLMQKTYNAAIHSYIEGFEGGKSGYTPDAGRCLASSAFIDGMSIIVVTGLSGYADGPVDDAILLYQWTENSYDILNIVTEGLSLTTIPVAEAKSGEEFIRLYTEETISKRFPVDTVLTVESEFIDSITAPAYIGDELGYYMVKNGEEILYEKTYYLDHDIEQTTYAMIRDFVFDNPLIVLFYGGVIVFLLFFLPHFLLTKIKF